MLQFRKTRDGFKTQNTWHQLNKMNLRNDNLCSLGNSHPETLVHVLGIAELLKFSF